MANANRDLPFGLCEEDSELLKSFHKLLKSLRSLTISNIEFYNRGKSSIHARYYATSCVLLERCQVLEPVLTDVIPRLKDFDFSETVRANGYRSFVSITERCCLHLHQLCRHISINKTSLLFRSSHYLKELEDFVDTLGQLIACLGYLKQLISYTRNGELFLDENQPVADDLLLEVEMLNTDCFYGRCLGFQFCESIQKVLPGILIAMATFSECYEENSQVMQLATSIFNSGKYVVDQDLRAKQVVDVTRTADIKFCKAFWSIPDSPLLSQLRSFTFPHVQVSEVISLDPENFELPVEGSTDGTTVTITPPCAHTGPAPVKVRIISHCLRDGMTVTKKRFQPKTGSSKPVGQPKSKGLLFHCHGGGFVSQSSQSHENYLRMWACKLKVPIMSVDYSLSPDLPFPRALEECFYAYAWALKNPESLGWTGENICFAGDSAGGNLAVSTALRAVSYEIRVPDGIMAAYTPFLIQYMPSPSRLMAMIDPLLPVGILTRCLAAYAGIADEFASALAKPIFCNPGKYETWEEVKAEETQHTEYVQHYESHDLLQGTISSGNSIGANELADPSETKATPGLAQCQSVESLNSDQFVVCDMDALEMEIENYAGTVVSLLDNTKANKNNINKSEEITGTKVEAAKEQNELPLENSSEVVCRPKLPKEQHVCNNTYQSPDGGQEWIKERADSDRLGTVEDILRDIDSTAGIHVEDFTTGNDMDVISNEAGSSSSLYASCQELIDAANTCSSSSDLMSASCHSIEDIVECSSDEPLDNFEKDLTEENGANKLDIKTYDHESLTKYMLEVNKAPKCVKQLSVSDTSDSGIHVDIEAINTSNQDTANLNETINLQTPDNSITDGCDIKPRSLTEPTTLSPNHGVPKQRAFSLDLATTYHPGQFLDNNLFSKSASHSPVSPELPIASRSFSPKRYSVQRKITQSPIQLFKQLPIVKNLYMSPMLATDDLLSGLPPLHLMACHFDPLLDDSIVFAKRLQQLDRTVELHVFDSLPHGFLCFADTSLECKQAAIYCMETIRKVLRIEEQ